jgi:hypothetical protein
MRLHARPPATSDGRVSLLKSRDAQASAIPAQANAHPGSISVARPKQWSALATVAAVIWL